MFNIFLTWTIQLKIISAVGKFFLWLNNLKKGSFNLKIPFR